MCVDFIDLNKAMPKIITPCLSLIILSVMDAHSNYNQILMAEEDEKTHLYNLVGNLLL